MDLERSFTIDLLKIDHNKYVFCVIKVRKHRVIYYFGQDKPHLTHRWMEPHYWASFDAKIRELSAAKIFENLTTQPLSFNLVGPLHLKIAKTNIPIEVLCKTVSDSVIAANDVIAAIECNLEYDETIYHTSERKFQSQAGLKNGISSKTKDEPSFKSVLKENSDTTPNKINKKIYCHMNLAEIRDNSEPFEKNGIQNFSRIKLPNEMDKIPKKFDGKCKLSSENEKPKDITRKRKKDAQSVDPIPAERTVKNDSDKALEFLIEPKLDKSSSTTLKSSDSCYKLKCLETWKVTSDSISKSSKIKTLQTKDQDVKESRIINDWLHKTSSQKCKQKTDKHNKLNADQLVSDLDNLHSSSQRSKRIQKQSKEHSASTILHDHESPLAILCMKTTPKKIQILNLLNLSEKEILETFDEYQPMLDVLFRKFVSKPMQGWNNGVNHYTVMDLLSSDTQLLMMNKLNECYEKGTGVPKYGELFSMVLMPEWILSIFMKQYNMDRDTAIEHIKAQNNLLLTQSEIRFNDTIF